MASSNQHAIDEEQTHSSNMENSGDNTLRNTAGDDAEVLMHVFQPSHSLTPVDHVTL